MRMPLQIIHNSIVPGTALEMGALFSGQVRCLTLDAFLIKLQPRGMQPRFVCISYLGCTEQSEFTPCAAATAHTGWTEHQREQLMPVL